MIGQSLSNTNETYYSVQIAKICNLNQALNMPLEKLTPTEKVRVVAVVRIPSARSHLRACACSLLLLAGWGLLPACHGQLLPACACVARAC